MNWPQNDYWFGPVVGVDAGRARAPPRGGAAAQPQPALLAPDGGAATRRRRGLPRPAPARRRRRRHARRTRAGALRPGVAPASRRVHGARAAHRASAATGRPEAVRRLGRDRLLPDRSPSADQRRRLPRPRLLAVPDPARRDDPGARREPAAGRQEPRRHAHHQRRLPRPSGRMEHRRGGRPPGRVLPRAEADSRGRSGIARSFSRTFRRCCAERASSSPGHRSNPCEALMETNETRAGGCESGSRARTAG